MDPQVNLEKLNPSAKRWQTKVLGNIPECLYLKNSRHFGLIIKNAIFISIALYLTESSIFNSISNSETGYGFFCFLKLCHVAIVIR